jgi:membrane protease YdiL (CAAX protease family)
MDLEPVVPSTVEQTPALPSPYPLTAGRALVILVSFFLAEIAAAFVVAIVVAIYFAAQISDRGMLASRIQAVALLPASLAGALVGSLVALRMTRRSFPGSIASGALKPLGWVTVSFRALAASALLGSLIALGVQFLLIRAFPPRPEQSFGPLVQAAATPGLSRLGWAVIALALAPPIEEFLFRGVLLHGFAKTWGLTTAVLLTSVIFITFHLPETHSYWPALSGIALLAGVTAAVRLSTKALGPAIALHAGYNLVFVVVVYARAA